MKFKVTDKASSPGGNLGECTYCRRLVGLSHDDNCVLVKKKVRVRAVIEYVAEVPNSWDKDAIEFFWNDSSWCADNVIRDLKDFINEERCLCQFTKLEYLGDASSPYLKEE